MSTNLRDELERVKKIIIDELKIPHQDLFNSSKNVASGTGQKLKELMKKKLQMPSTMQPPDAIDDVLIAHKLIEPQDHYVPYLPRLSPTVDNEILSFSDKAREFISNYVPFQREDLFVAGGIFPRLYHSLPIRDIDVYVKDEDTFFKIQKEYEYAFYATEPDYTTGVGYFQKMNDKYYKYKHPDGITVDFITFHDPKSVDYIQTFDFGICKFAITESNVYCDYYNFENIKKKIIQYTPGMFGKTSSGNSTLHRLLKYIKLGFEPDAGCLDWMMDDLMNKRVKSYTYYKGK